MRFRNFVLMALGNVIVAGVLTVLFINFSGARPNSSQPPVQVITVEVRITNTPGATQTPWIVTATLPDGVVPLPTGLFGTPEAGAGGTPGDSAAAPEAQPTDPTTLLPANCIPHSVESGDNPSALALEYGVDFQDIMQINNLTDETAALLQIGDVLVIPLDGCPLVQLPTRTPEPETVAGVDGTAEAGVSGGPATATVTLAPTATTASVSIVRVINPGDVTAEGVEIRNSGELIDLTGWTITDSQGNTYTFPTGRLFTQGSATVLSRVGQNTPVAYFWGRTDSVWEQGDVVTLTDDDGVVQSTYRIGGDITLPGG